MLADVVKVPRVRRMIAQLKDERRWKFMLSNIVRAEQDDVQIEMR